MLSESQIQLLRETTGIRSFRCFETIGSTNDEAKRIVRQGDVSLPCLIIAKNQTAGRGRGSNRWLGGEGALTFSLVLDSDQTCDEMNLDARETSQIALWTALAVRSAIELSFKDLGSGVTSVEAPIQVKWPNDVLMGGRKVAGILIESLPGQASLQVPSLIVGIGVNVTNRLAAVDALKDSGRGALLATSMSETLSADASNRLVLFAVLNRILIELNQALTSARTGLANLWRPHCVLRGQAVKFSIGSTSLNSQGACEVGACEVGDCEGIDDQGALLVRTATELTKVHSGTVRLASG